MTLSSVMTAVTITNMGLPVWVGVIVGILTGGVMGLVNGVLIARFKLPPFIATFGTLNVARGLSLVINQSRPIYYSDTPEFNQGVMGNLFGINIAGDFGIPNIAIIMFGAVIVAAFILNRTALGRYTFALGSNEEAVRLSGVNVQAWKIAVYTLAGLFAGLGGVLIGARQLCPARARFWL
jgi:ribose transport system permease protein